MILALEIANAFEKTHELLILNPSCTDRTSEHQTLPSKASFNQLPYELGGQSEARSSAKHLRARAKSGKQPR